MDQNQGQCQGVLEQFQNRKRHTHDREPEQKRCHIRIDMRTPKRSQSFSPCTYFPEQSKDSVFPDLIIGQEKIGLIKKTGQ